MREAQDKCADLESRRDELARQWERLQANEEEMQARLEALQAQLKDLRRVAEAAPDVLADCRSLKPGELQALLQATAGARGRLAILRARLDDLTLRHRHAAVIQALQHQLETLRTQLQDAEQKKLHLEGQTSQADLDRANREMLLQNIQAERSEIERLGAVIADIEKVVEENKARTNRMWLAGDYDGPYVLLECDDQGVVVYPGQKRISLDAPASEIDDLRRQVTAAGAAVLVLRPSGFGQSYAKFYDILVDIAGQGQSGNIILSFWPVDAEEALTDYLPEEN